ncbi:uncharacterized protein LOC128788449 [Vidua chalybeata]|uniref:uncharacterized protein LOC128788449 n=1 Tax=Vidua chalybeata TaxID=81927 RepID=UPI0023A90731|nr:uncharacterized protein LOC128788449 [Vidua chalybeata]
MSSWVCLQAGRWDTAGAGEEGCAPKVCPCTIKITLAGSRVRGKKQLPPLLLTATALSRQKDPEQRQDLRMNVQALAVTTLLLVLLCSAPALSGTLGSQASNLERQAGAGFPEEAPWPPGDGGDKLPGQGSERSHPLASAWKVMREAHPSSRSLSKAMAKALLGSGEQVAPGKPWRLPLQPSRSRMARLSHHLKDYGKFNSDTHSCHSIQSRPCQKPSDCGGCLGLYTCKLPAGTCNLKSVSRQRGGFLQSIQSR